MDMVGRRFNAVTTGRGGAGEMAGSANNAAKPTAGSNMAAADDGATASAAVEPSEIHKVPGVFDLAGRIVCGRQGRSCRPVYRAYRAVRYVARCASNEGGDFRADSADSGGRGCRVRNPIHQQAVPAVGCICVLARSRGSADFRTSDQLRSLGDIRCRWAICCPAGCRLRFFPRLPRSLRSAEYRISPALIPMQTVPRSW